MAIPRRGMPLDEQNSLLAGEANHASQPENQGFRASYKTIASLAAGAGLLLVFAAVYTPAYQRSGLGASVKPDLGAVDAAAMAQLEHMHEGLYGLKPLTEGNEVTFLPITNIPPGGFVDADLDSIRGYKADNANRPKDDFIARDIVYFAAARVTATHVSCGDKESDTVREAARVALAGKVVVDDIRVANCVSTENGAHAAELEVAVRRSKVELPSPAAFARKVFGIIESEDFLETWRTTPGSGLGLEEKEVEIKVDQPFVRASVIIEGPQGSGEALRSTNGPANPVAVTELEQLEAVEGLGKQQKKVEIMLDQPLVVAEGPAAAPQPAEEPAAAPQPAEEPAAAPQPAEEPAASPVARVGQSTVAVDQTLE